MNKVLITGAGGMVGSHLVEYYCNKGVETLGTYYKPTVDMNEFDYRAKFLECDVRYFTNVYRIVEEYRPNIIFHLAAQSYPAVSWEKPQETMEINVTGTINLFESIKKMKEIDVSYNPRVIVACSSAEYGDSLNKCEEPIKEESELLPLHPYGVSKMGQDLLSYQYFKNFGIEAIRARIFNTTGPRKRNDVVSDFTRRIVSIEKGIGSEKHLRVGNLKTKRAITDVRDLVSALTLLSTRGIAGAVYNISGSVVYQIEEIVTMIRKHTALEFTVEADPTLMRVTDEKIIYGNSAKLNRDTGWVQKIPLDTTIKDMLDYWRNVL